MADTEKEVKKTRGYLSKITGKILRLLFDAAVYISILAVVFIVSKKAYNFCYRIFGDATVTDTKHAVSREIEIEGNEKKLEIADKLYKEGLILDKYSFTVKMKLDDLEPAAGTYTISSDMNYSEILAVIAVAS